LPRWVVYVLIYGAILGAIAAMSYSGFCFAGWRSLSDDEAIDAAIDHVLTLPLHAVEAPSGGFMRFGPEKQVGYRDRHEFRRLNPDCCKIVAHNPVWIGFKHQLFGYAAKSVHVRYNVRYINEFGGVSQMEAEAQRAITNCGHILNTGR
jgi:hypothetical protein